MAATIATAPCPRLSEHGGNVVAWAEAMADWLDATLAELDRELGPRLRAHGERWTVANHSASRSLDVSAATLGEVRQALGTLLVTLAAMKQLRVTQS